MWETKMQNQELRSNNRILYHGTIREKAEQILKEGLIPQPYPKAVDPFYREPHTFLTPDPDYAAKYGEITLKVELPEGIEAWEKTELGRFPAVVIKERILPRYISIFERRQLYGFSTHQKGS